MITIISSTNRTDARSYGVSEYYKNLLEQKGEIVNIVNLNQLPEDVIVSALYENSQKNEFFNELTKVVQDSQKLVFVIPEYNGSFPGVLKVFVDGLKYPEGLKGKKAALIGLGSGQMGGVLALSHFTDILHYLGCHVLANKIKLPKIHAIFDGETITDDFVHSLIKTQIKDFLKF